MNYHHEFLNYLQWEKNYSSHTIIAYQKDIEDFLFFLDIKKWNMFQLSPQYVSEYLDHLSREKISPRSVGRKISSLRSFYQYLARKKQIHHNPFLLFTAPKSTKIIPKTLNPTQMSEWLENMPKNTPLERRNYTILLLLYTTGIRSQELCDLKLSDLLLAQNKIRVFGKGRKERIIPILPIMHLCFKNYLADRNNFVKDNSELVFLSVRGYPLQTIAIRKLIDFHSNFFEEGNKMHPHAFRYTFASHLLENEVNLRHIQELLGHARLSVTERYTKVSIQNLKTKFQKFHPHGSKGF